MSERYAHSEVTTVPGVRGGHHIFCVEHLLSELGDGDSTVLLAPTSGQRSVTGHKEVESWEGNHVDGQLPQI